MKNIFYCAIVFTFITINTTLYSESNNCMPASIPFGQRYIDLMSQFIKEKFNADYLVTLKQLFAPNVKKIVNSNIVCTNLDQLIAQIKSVEQIYGIDNIHVLELIESKDARINVLRSEVIYKDKTIECVVTILKCNDNGLIEEINEVFGEKAVYQWQP